MQTQTEIAILGGGPAGYSAAFRAADLGKRVILIERYPSLGGVCLNVGCIPAKALLCVAKLIEDANDFAKVGVDLGKPKINLGKLYNWKDSVVQRLSVSLNVLIRQRGIEVLTGTGKLISPNQFSVQTKKGEVVVEFEKAIIAAGSSSVKLSFLPDDERIVDSTDLLKLKEVPKEFLIIGGGVIGLEMAAIYHSLGSKITVVEAKDQLISSSDRDIIQPLFDFISKKYKQILLNTKVTKVEQKMFGLEVTFEHRDGRTETQRFDKILVAVGRKPNGNLVGAENVGIKVDDFGFIGVDERYCTNIPNIYAAGDIVSNPMLAHKAIFEGQYIADIIAGKKDVIFPKNIASVAYTDPEVAEIGLTETAAIENKIKYSKVVFPWTINGRSLTINRQEGLTKLLFETYTHKIIGGAIVGSNAGELISEIALAIETGLTAEDIASTVHPHPTLSETTMLAAQSFLGTIVDYN